VSKSATDGHKMVRETLAELLVAVAALREEVRALHEAVERWRRSH